MRPYHKEQKRKKDKRKNKIKQKTWQYLDVFSYSIDHSGSNDSFIKLVFVSIVEVVL